MKLDEYLEEEGIKTEVFAKKIGLSRRQLFTIRKTNKCKKAMMFLIKEITYGKVAEGDWSIEDINTVE